ncbi:MAG TPA: ATP-binding protein [Pyrinomonadaceae bacterium]|jgi:two-component system sensor histidine kinase PilS (NtrC family)
MIWNWKSGGTFRSKLWLLVAGRLAAAVLLLIASALWTREQLGALDRDGWHGTLPIFISVVALSLCYAVALSLSSNLRLQAGIQLFADVVLVTWLVWATGDITSPYTVLYIIIIAVSSLLLGPKAAIYAAVGCASVFTAISLAAVTGILPRFARFTLQTSYIKTIQTIGLNDVAFLVVGLLAARLAERQSRYDVELTETTQTLANLRALHERIVESIRSGVVTTDMEGRIYTFNTAAEEITGYEAGDVRGQAATIFFGELDERVHDSLRAAEAGEPTPRFEADCLSSDGLHLRLGFGISPLFSEAGETTGLVITFQDLTDVRAMEETSRRQDRLAAVGRVAAGIAHEIRNPLAAMRGAIQVLHSDVETDSSEAQLMEIILRESDRLNKIIADFLTYARPRMGAFTSVDLREALHETFTLLRHSPEIRDGHVLEDVLPDEPMMASADSAQLKQVFWNLARNAMQAMPAGGTLRAELQRTSAGRLRITFTDTGQGMTPEQVERLFEPFSSSTSGGTGLGLSIVYQIIRDHGGIINVRSREGQGTTITIELPSISEEQRSPANRV